jgi:hypothetical protein
MEAVVETPCDLLNGKRLHPSSRQFDGKRHPVQPAADVRHPRPILPGQREYW